MKVKEKALLVQILLEDIRGNWCDIPIKRAKYARQLCRELYRDTGNEDWHILEMSCDDYIVSRGLDGRWDGRWFRAAYPSGYINMEVTHNLPKTLGDKSNEFRIKALEYMTEPQYRFRDWREFTDEIDKY